MNYSKSIETTWNLLLEMIAGNDSKLLKITQNCLNYLDNIFNIFKESIITFFQKSKKSVFGKTVENVWKHRDIKLVTTERRRKYLLSESYFNVSHRKFVGFRNKKTSNT